MGSVQTDTVTVQIRAISEVHKQLLDILVRHWCPDIQRVGCHGELREDCVTGRECKTMLNVSLVPPFPRL